VKLLLDTHILVWIAVDDAELTAPERKILAAPDVEVACSTVSLWELRLKWNSMNLAGARKSRVAPEIVGDLVRAAGWTFVPLLPAHAVTPLEVPVAHKDPFDELLLVQAQVEGMRLLTRDRALIGHPLAIH
jgi:PIN domain nuclease of toxin-antitoxin system